jgi:uncharacterized cupin superfamily protein
VTRVHWDDVDEDVIPDEARPLGGTWQSLGDAAGSVGVGCKRVRVPAGLMLTPPHVHTAEEEIFHLLAGTATLWQDGTTCVVGAGDTIVHIAGGDAHTLIAGADGFEALIFGHRRNAETGYLPRSRRVWVGRTALSVPEGHPWEEEAKLGIPDGEPGERPPNVRGFDEAPSAFEGRSRFLARGLAQQSGLNWGSLPPGEEGAPPHVHSAEEEVFVVLDGEGTLELWPPPAPGPHATEPQETHSVRRGHVVARPPGTRIPHSFRAGPAGLTYLAYGTREPNDIVWYPRSNKVFLRGLGVIARLEQLDWFDGEPE